MEQWSGGRRMGWQLFPSPSQCPSEAAHTNISCGLIVKMPVPSDWMYLQLSSGSSPSKVLIWGSFVAYDCCRAGSFRHGIASRDGLKRQRRWKKKGSPIWPSCVPDPLANEGHSLRLLSPEIAPWSFWSLQKAFLLLSENQNVNQPSKAFWSPEDTMCGLPSPWWTLGISPLEGGHYQGGTQNAATLVPMIMWSTGPPPPPGMIIIFLPSLVCSHLFSLMSGLSHSSFI